MSASPTNIPFDAILPKDMAIKAENMGVTKSKLGFFQAFALAVLAGAFIAMGAIFATTVSAGGMTVRAADGAAAFTIGLPYGVTRLLAGLVFSLGLILVIIGGAELFTGNNLIVMAWVSRKVTTTDLLRNWVIVYIGNFVGAILTAYVMFLSKQYVFGDSAMGAAILKTGVAKTSLEFIPAVALGIFCNALVCMAVWLCLSARSTTDKILSIILPISAFVAAGFEHSIANMYFIPIALFVKYLDPVFYAARVAAEPTVLWDSLTWANFLLKNLLPVTIGNIIGGTVLVGFAYWFIYLRPERARQTAEAAQPALQK
ncbi:MAG: formate/nitrite transporter family protein [Anaerolineae bacterium]|nr:formate/nitrite transporter family protein [Anaerolineae bacterium]